MKSLFRSTVFALSVAASMSTALLASGSASAAGIPGAPAPFDKGGVRIAVVNYLSGSDFLQAFSAGAARQAKALGIDAKISESKQNPDTQRELIEQAINLGVKGIVINNGVPEALKDVVQKALKAGIKVSTFDLNLGLEGVAVIEQSDHDIARLALEQAVKEKGETFNIGELYVAGFLPLDNRHESYNQFLSKHKGIKHVAQWGVVNSTTPASVADQTKTILRAHPEINVIFTPWDEFARGVKLGLDELGLSSKIKIYGVDISTSDIQAIREPGSPWVATAATNASVVGEVAVRAVSLLIAGQNPGAKIAIKPILVTRDDLVKNDIKTIEELSAKLPAFSANSDATAKWIPLVAH